MSVEANTAPHCSRRIELLNTRLSGALFPYVAVALLDVVMETDQALAAVLTMPIGVFIS